MSEAEPLPERIGRHYQVEKLLGAGGTSRVLQVVDLRNAQRVALKQAHAHSSNQHARADALFRQEFHVLSRIAHPNVVSVLDYGVEENRSFTPWSCSRDAL